jgi:hypothetical protein
MGSLKRMWKVAQLLDCYMMMMMMVVVEGSGHDIL